MGRTPSGGVVGMPDDALAKATEAVRRQLEQRLCAGCAERTTWRPDDPEPPACVLTCNVGSVLERAREIARAVLEAARYGELIGLLRRALQSIEGNMAECRFIMHRDACETDCDIYDKCLKRQLRDDMKAALQRAGKEA